MQKCSICEKPIYRATHQTGKVVCGSCPLNKAPGGATGKSYSEVRMDMAKLVTKQVSTQETVMSDLKVKSNVGGRVLLLDGRHPVKFDAKGIGRCPAHLRALLEREMIMKPGRFTIIEEEVAPEVAPVVEAPVVAEEVAPEPVAEAVEIPADIDQSFLAADETTVKPAKASKKK